MHLIRHKSLILSQCKIIQRAFIIPACLHYGVPSVTILIHYAENEYAIPIRLHCNELRALCMTTNVLRRTAEIGALLLKCVLIVYIWPEKGVVVVPKYIQLYTFLHAE